MFDRCNRRALRAASLAALEALCSRPGVDLEPGAFAAVGGVWRGRALLGGWI